MSYTPGFEGPHPSQLPVVSDDNDGCGHSGLMDRWHGDDTTGPGHVWSCLQQCGVQVFYPDEPGDTDVPGFEAPASPITFNGQLFTQLRHAYDEHRTKYKPLTEFKVTQTQLDQLVALVPPADAPPSPAAFLSGIPVRLVDAFEESTVYELWLRSFLKGLRESLSADGPQPPPPTSPFAA